MDKDVVHGVKRRLETVELPGAILLIRFAIHREANSNRFPPPVTTVSSAVPWATAKFPNIVPGS